MKKYLYAGLLACTIASCTDDFLKEEMVSTITQDYFNTEQGLDQLIVGTPLSHWHHREGIQGPYWIGLRWDVPEESACSR